MLIPNSVRLIYKLAFTENPLTQVRFLGTIRKEQNSEHSSGNVNSNCPETVEQSLVIGEQAFFDCKNLRQVIFDPGSAVTEIQSNAFCYSNLKSFTAPPSLRMIGDVAFRECGNLKKFELNDDIQRLGWLCLYRTGMKKLHLPLRMKMKQE